MDGRGRDAHGGGGGGGVRGRSNLRGEPPRLRDGIAIASSLPNSASSFTLGTGSQNPKPSVLQYQPPTTSPPIDALVGMRLPKLPSRNHTKRRHKVGDPRQLPPPLGPSPHSWTFVEAPRPWQFRPHLPIQGCGHQRQQSGDVQGRSLIEPIPVVMRLGGGGGGTAESGLPRAHGPGTHRS